MRKLLLIPVLILLSGLLYSQGGNTITITGSGAPSGSCSFIFRYVDSATGNEYNCKVSTWNLVSGGGGGTATTGQVPVPASPAISYVDMILWLSADCITLTDGATCGVPTNGTAISYWQDRSGSNSGFSVTSGTCTFNTSQINGKPAITFSTCHVNGYMFPMRSVITVFAVVKNTGAAKGGIFGADVASSFYYSTGASSKEQAVDNANSSNVGTGTAALDANFHQINVTCAQNANPAFRIDRTTDTTLSGANCSLAQNATNWNLGYNIPGGSIEPLAGSIAELIVYRRILSSTEISAVETYLNTKYGL